MWLLTTFGFFSVVEKAEDSEEGMLTIRSRVKGDLENLRQQYLPDLGPITASANTDYRYRARVKREAASRMVHDLHYGNFKDAVASQQGYARSKVYHKVWDALYTLQSGDFEPTARAAGRAIVPNTSYGGVLFDTHGRMLLRRPANEYDGYVWTFPKGRPHGDRTAEEVALREVLEETGYPAEIIGPVPGVFQGGTGKNEYFIMTPTGDPAPFDPAETEAVVWVEIDEASTYLAQTRNQTGRERDLAVLNAAMAAYHHLC